MTGKNPSRRTAGYRSAALLLAVLLAACALAGGVKLSHRPGRTNLSRVQQEEARAKQLMACAQRIREQAARRQPHPEVCKWALASRNAGSVEPPPRSAPPPDAPDAAPPPRRRAAPPNSRASCSSAASASR